METFCKKTPFSSLKSVRSENEGEVLGRRGAEHSLGWGFFRMEGVVL